MTDKTEVMLADGWIKHDGGQCPVPEEECVTAKLRSNMIGNMKACELYWEHDGRDDDIIAYKLEQPQ